MRSKIEYLNYCYKNLKSPKDKKISKLKSSESKEQYTNDGVYFKDIFKFLSDEKDYITKSNLMKVIERERFGDKILLEYIFELFDILGDEINEETFSKFYKMLVT